jgi:hypothetical protein
MLCRIEHFKDDCHLFIKTVYMLGGEIGGDIEGQRVSTRGQGRARLDQIFHTAILVRLSLTDDYPAPCVSPDGQTNVDSARGPPPRRVKYVCCNSAHDLNSQDS